MTPPYDWTEKAACKGQPRDVFFPEPGTSAATRAREICVGCPIRRECLEFAIETRQEYGIWGGMNAGERQLFENKRARRRPTISGIMRGASDGSSRRAAPLTGRQTWTADG